MTTGQNLLVEELELVLRWTEPTLRRGSSWMGNGLNDVTLRVESDEGGLGERARTLADALGIALADEPRSLLLVLGRDGLRLEGDLPTGRASLRLNFAGGRLRSRLRGAAHTPLARALGGAKAGPVFDTTAGLMRDALTAASIGAQVYAVEVHPVVFALAEDALARAADEPTLTAALERVQLRQGDAVACWPAQAPKVVLIDPMFDDETAAPRKAASKKEMALLQALHTCWPITLDVRASGETLLATAVESGASRVIVKRSENAPQLGPGVHHAVRARGYRFDVYLPKVR